MKSIEKLREILEQDIRRFDKESQKHKRLYRRAQTAVIGLTATTAVVAGAGLILPEGSGRFVQFTVLTLASFTTAVTSWLEMRRARELWQHEREVYYALKDILREVDFYDAMGAMTPEKVEAYFRQAASILGSSSQKWARIQQKRLEEGSQG